MVSGLFLISSLDPKYSHTKLKGKLFEENRVFSKLKMEIYIAMAYWLIKVTGMTCMI